MSQVSSGKINESGTFSPFCSPCLWFNIFFFSLVGLELFALFLSFNILSDTPFLLLIMFYLVSLF